MGDYEGWWERAKIPPRLHQRVADALTRARRNEEEYRKAADATGIPWTLIAAIHELEAGASLGAHIANGDPLEERTVHVPKGHPQGLNRPWTWHEAAVVELRELHRPHDGVWTIRAMLEAGERFNGLGYRKRGSWSPYLTGSTDLDQGGKYIADGVYDSKAKTKQVGVLAMLLAFRGVGEPLPPW